MLLGNTGLSTSRLGAAISPLVCVTQRRLPSAFSPGHRHLACTSKVMAYNRYISFGLMAAGPVRLLEATDPVTAAAQTV